MSQINDNNVHIIPQSHQDVSHFLAKKTQHTKDSDLKDSGHLYYHPPLRHIWVLGTVPGIESNQHVGLDSFDPSIGRELSIVVSPLLLFLGFLLQRIHRTQAFLIRSKRSPGSSQKKEYVFISSMYFNQRCIYRTQGSQIKITRIVRALKHINKPEQ